MKALIYIVTAWLGLSCAALAQTETLTVSTGIYPPFTDPDHPRGGSVNSLVADMADQAGMEARFDYLPWMRSLQQARDGAFNASSFWYESPEREAEFIHVGPILYDRLVLFHRTDTRVNDWERLSDLDDFIFGAVTGYTFTSEFWDLGDDGTLSIEIAPDDVANFRKLLAGRIDVYPMSAEAGMALLQSTFTPQQRQQITYHDKPLVVTEGYLLISRAQSGAQQLADRLAAALTRIRRTQDAHARAPDHSGIASTITHVSHN